MNSRKLEETLFKGLMAASLFLVLSMLVGIVAVVAMKGLSAMNLSMILEMPKGGYYLGKEGLLDQPKQPRMRGSWSRVASSSSWTSPWHCWQLMFRTACFLCEKTMFGRGITFRATRLPSDSL